MNGVGDIERRKKKYSAACQIRKDGLFTLAVQEEMPGIEEEEDWR